MKSKSSDLRASIMVSICQRSIGVQVSLCKCESNSSASSKFVSNDLKEDLNKRMDSYSKEETKDQSSSSCDPGFLYCQTKSSHFPWNSTETETNEKNSKSGKDDTCDQDQDTRYTEESRLLKAQDSRTSSVHFSPCESPSSPTPISPPSRSVILSEHQEQSQQAVSGSGSGNTVPVDSVHRRDHSHSYHFKRKLVNFRSDSVFSDVMPMASSSTSQEYSKSSGSVPSEKSGSLSSLKPHESKWTSLRKKLSKINSSTSTTKKSLEQKQSNPTKSIENKRTMLQRAKTLSILPVRSSKEKEDQPKKPVRERKPKVVEEMFNVGGEMNLIPLELLIDVNDLNISK